jgi:threonine/homoserine/homoserine lactone efflux protein
MANWICSIAPDFAGTGVFLARGIALGLGAAVPIGPVNVQIARRALRGSFLAGAALGCGAVTADVTYAALSSLSFARLLNRPMVVNLIAAAGALLLTWLGVACLRAAVKAWRWDPIAADDEGRGPGCRTGANLTKTVAEAAPMPCPAPAHMPPAPPAAGSPPSHRERVHSSYVTGLLMTLLNPMTLAFWFTVVPGATVVAGPAPVAPPAAIVKADNAGTLHRAPKLTQEHTSYLPITCAGVFIGTLGWVITFSGLLALAGRRRRNGWLAAADAVGGATLLFFAVVMVWRLVRTHV